MLHHVKEWMNQQLTFTLSSKVGQWCHNGRKNTKQRSQ
jgi:hypothetical protein